MTDETNCGSPQSPWVIEGAPGQRIDLSVVNFGWTASSNNQSTGGACQLFGYIIERSLNINRSLCGGSTRESHLYTSMSNDIEIHILPMRLRQIKANFLLKYKGQSFIFNKNVELLYYAFETNKRSKDLGALLDSCSWNDIGNFLQTCIKNSLLQTKSFEIWVNSDTVLHYACINLTP